MQEAARPYAVDALLVFLDLLEGQSQGVREPFLAHPEHDPPSPHPASDVPVDVVRRLLLQALLLFFDEPCLVYAKFKTFGSIISTCNLKV